MALPADNSSRYSQCAFGQLINGLIEVQKNKSNASQNQANENSLIDDKIILKYSEKLYEEIQNTKAHCILQRILSQWQVFIAQSDNDVQGFSETPLNNSLQLPADTNIIKKSESNAIFKSNQLQNQFTNFLLQDQEEEEENVCHGLLSIFFTRMQYYLTTLTIAQANNEFMKLNENLNNQCNALQAALNSQNNLGAIHCIDENQTKVQQNQIRFNPSMRYNDNEDENDQDVITHVIAPLPESATQKDLENNENPNNDQNNQQIVQNFEEHSNPQIITSLAPTPVIHDLYLDSQYQDPQYPPPLPSSMYNNPYDDSSMNQYNSLHDNQNMTHYHSSADNPNNTNNFLLPSLSSNLSRFSQKSSLSPEIQQVFQILTNRQAATNASSTLSQYKQVLINFNAQPESDNDFLQQFILCNDLELFLSLIRVLYAIEKQRVIDNEKLANEYPYIYLKNTNQKFITNNLLIFKTFINRVFQPYALTYDQIMQDSKLVPIAIETSYQNLYTQYPEQKISLQTMRENINYTFRLLNQQQLENVKQLTTILNQDKNTAENLFNQMLVDKEISAQDFSSIATQFLQVMPSIASQSADIQMTTLQRYQDQFASAFCYIPRCYGFYEDEDAINIPFNEKQSLLQDAFLVKAPVQNYLLTFKAMQLIIEIERDLQLPISENFKQQEAFLKKCDIHQNPALINNSFKNSFALAIEIDPAPNAWSQWYLTQKDTIWQFVDQYMATHPSIQEQNLKDQYQNIKIKNSEKYMISLTQADSPLQIPDSQIAALESLHHLNKFHYEIKFSES